MTATNPNPIANPLTDRPIGNLNFSKMSQNGYIKIDRNAKLPETIFDFEAWQKQQDSLHVPDTSPEAYSFSSNTNWQMKNGIRTLSYDDSSQYWNDNEIMRFPEIQGNYKMTKAEIDLIKMLQQKDAELCVNMSDQQKNLLNHIDDFLGKSKLIEESII